MSLVSTERLHTGKVVNLDRDTVRYPDGSTGQLEMVRHPGASAVVPLLDEPRGAGSPGADDPPVQARGQ